jgi:hypothetical protein
MWVPHEGSLQKFLAEVHVGSSRGFLTGVPHGGSLQRFLTEVHVGSHLNGHEKRAYANLVNWRKEPPPETLVRNIRRGSRPRIARPHVLMRYACVPPTRARHRVGLHCPLARPVRQTCVVVWRSNLVGLLSRFPWRGWPASRSAATDTTFSNEGGSRYMMKTKRWLGTTCQPALT